MAVRVRDFSRAHPSTDANHASVLARLETVIERMDELGGQQVGGFLSKHSSVVRRKEIRRDLRNGFLRHLVTIARSAEAESPGLAAKFELPAATASNKAFQTVARKMLEQGEAAKDVLAKHGLGATLLDDLRAAVAAFDASVAETNDGLQGHVLARAELDTLSEEVSLLVGMLDGINQYRFLREPELLTAWEQARHVVTGPQAKASETENPATSPGPAPATPGEVRPAA